MEKVGWKKISDGIWIANRLAVVSYDKKIL
jgi:hypothetical protein